MTASTARLARLALVAVALSLAVFGAVSAQADRPDTTATNLSLIKAAAVAAPQAVAERPSQPNRLTGDLFFVAAVLVALAGFGWALAQQGDHRLPPVAAHLTWRRRGPPFSFVS
jgi:hypothetical protein